MTFGLELVGVAVLILLNAFFVAAETISWRLPPSTFVRGFSRHNGTPPDAWHAEWLDLLSCTKSSDGGKCPWALR